MDSKARQQYHLKSKSMENMKKQTTTTQTTETTETTTQQQTKINETSLNFAA